MADSHPSFDSSQSFCGNCGTAVQASDQTCPNCALYLSAPDCLAGPSSSAPADYVPYCRNCGTPVRYEESHTCQRCGVAPLCSQHFDFGTGMCDECTTSQASVSHTAVGAGPDHRTAPIGPWAQGRPNVTCPNCGARIHQGVRHCPQCSFEQPIGLSIGSSGEIEYMGFWVRVAAFLIDSVITGIVAGIIGSSIGVPFLGSVVSILYYIIFTGIRGQTPGKMLLGIQVVDANGIIPSWKQIVMRELIGKIISAVIVLVGYLWVIWDPGKRGWHDHIGQTYVGRKKPDN